MSKFADDKVAEKLGEVERKEEEALMRALAQKYGHTYVNLRGTTINTEALRLIPEDAARIAECAIFERAGNRISVAVRNPAKPATKEMLETLAQANLTVTLFITSLQSLEHAWGRYHDIKHAEASTSGVLSLVEKQVGGVSERTKTLEDAAARINALTTSDRAHQVSEILEVILGSAIALHASDVHIEPEEKAVRLRFRLDGVLIDILDLPTELYRLLDSRLKLLSGLKLNKADEAQDGRFTIEHDGTALDIRSSIIPGAFGESIVMRLLDPSSASLTIDSLGLNPILRAVLEEEIQRPNGMIVTTGPTGSGKTTSLYAILRHIHTPEVKIITLEDPIEYKIEGVVQTQVTEHYSFAEGLRAILRQDPDVILVGEIRDREVAETAMHAAQTGHLVFSTLHTNSAAGAFPRLLDLGIDRETVGSAVNLVLGQRLVRILCETCKKPHVVTNDEYVIMRNVLKNIPSGVTITPEIKIFEPSGCDACNGTGFRGRISICEAIRVDKAVSDMVISDPREITITEAAIPQGIPSMQEDGILKVIGGITSLPERKRVIDIRPPTESAQ